MPRSQSYVRFTPRSGHFLRGHICPASLGLGRVYPHMLRHSCGYYLSNRGTDFRLTQDYLGHRDPKHTTRYTRVAGKRFTGLWD